MEDACYLAVDLGGTHVRCGLARVAAGRVYWLRRAQEDTAGHAGLAQALAEFLDAEGERPRRAVVAVAGPTDGRTARMTNLSWQLDAEALGHAWAMPVRLLNDFAAAAHGLAALDAEELAVLQAGRADPDGVQVLLGAGTGLGIALLAGSAGARQVLEGEGGHCDFAPNDATEARLWAFLRARHGHVSWERVVSGQGLAATHEFVCAERGMPDLYAGSLDKPAAIGAAALVGQDAAACLAGEIFARAYGAAAGNLALLTLPRGGVYVGGGIAPKLLPLLQRFFIPAFRAKGRFGAALEKFPVAVVLADDLGMRGAALYAARAG